MLDVHKNTNTVHINFDLELLWDTQCSEYRRAIWAGSILFLIWSSIRSFSFTFSITSFLTNSYYFQILPLLEYSSARSLYFVLFLPFFYKAKVYCCIRLKWLRGFSSLNRNWTWNYKIHYIFKHISCSPN